MPLIFIQAVRMRQALAQLAEEIVRGGSKGPQANNQFKTMINQPNNLEESLEALNLSDTYIFVYATNMIKLIQSGDFNIITETRSEENILNLIDTPSQKSKIYGRILMTIAYHVQIKQRPHYIRQSMIDLAGLCLKTLFQDINNQNYLQNLLSTFMPNYKLDDRFINIPSDSIITPIFMRRDMDFNNLNGYCTVVQIFISMFQFITIQSGQKQYYQFRRSIYIFRNSYLAYFLYFGVEHVKALFAVGSNQILRKVISLTLQLLQSVFMYPFTLSLHEYDVDDDINQCITNSNSGDVYLPNFFRHIICDQTLLTNIMQYYHYILDRTNQFQESRMELNSILKIIGRSICSNQYTFKSQEEREFSRKFSQSMIENICANFKFYDSYYLQSILEIVQKHLTMYDNIIMDIKRQILFKVLNFFKIIVIRSDINIFDGKRNPFARVFEITSLLNEYASDKLTEHENRMYLEECQLLLQAAFNRITSQEMNQVIYKYGSNQPNQIECFKELYQSLLPIFQANLQRNLTLFEQLDTSRLEPGARIMWLHLCSQLLPKTQANYRQTAIILKYYELASKGDTLASIRYIKTLAEQILEKCNDGVSETTLWRNIEQLSHASFREFIVNIINICIQNFNSTNNEIIDYSLQFFKSIYSNLKKNDNKAFQTYYIIVKELLTAINSTIFVKPQHFPKRRSFFNVIAIIWMNGDSIDYIYEIYGMISANIQQGTSESFYQYLHDITGVIEPIDRHQCFEIVAELAISDLKRLFQMHFKDEKTIDSYLSDPFFVKIMSRLVVSFVTDVNRKLYFETHTPIPYKIHEIVYPIVSKLVNPDRQIPPQLANILQRMINLNPLAPLISFQPVIGQLRDHFNDGYVKIVRCYFQNLQRVDNIEWMYDLIEQNVDFMVLWWEEAIFRDMHPNINLKTIAQSRIWSSIRQKESLAKLIFEIGYYDNSYWNVSNFQSQRDFVMHFSAIYT